MWTRRGSLSHTHTLVLIYCLRALLAGYHIPKGSIILPNIWAMNMNEKQYEHPERFNPERYLGPTPALESPVFGFGRRACLGVHYSTAAIFITAASILAVFDLRAQDKDGKDVQIEPAFTGGMYCSHSWLRFSLSRSLRCALTPGLQLFFFFDLFRFIGVLTSSFHLPLRSAVDRFRKVWLRGACWCFFFRCADLRLVCVCLSRTCLLVTRNRSPVGSPCVPRNPPSLSRQGHRCCKGVFVRGGSSWLT